jgi:hypothetical protein
MSVSKVIGDGTALANNLEPQGVVPLAALPVVPPLGATIGPNINGFTHAHIPHLVQFYNDSFGIQLGDTVPARRQQIQNWLTRNLQCAVFPVVLCSLLSTSMLLSFARSSLSFFRSRQILSIDVEKVDGWTLILPPCVL